MAKKKSPGSRGHEFTNKERAEGRLESDIQESLDEQLLVARGWLHQYVAMIAMNMAEDAERALPDDFASKGNEIVGKVVQLVSNEVAEYLKTP